MGLRISGNPFSLDKIYSLRSKISVSTTGYVPDASQFLEPVDGLAGTLSSLTFKVKRIC